MALPIVWAKTTGNDVQDVHGQAASMMAAQKEGQSMGTTTTEPVAETAALVRREESGVMALAFMDDRDFEHRLEALKKGQDRVRLIQKELMEPDEDYGVIPGTKKPTLLKPGAEKLCNVYGLVPTFEETTIEGDGEKTPTQRVRVTCRLHRGTADGPVVGEGMGAANSWERKHRYRSADRACPACGVVGTIRKSKYPDKQTKDLGWYCHARAGGCGANFHSKAPGIVDQEVGQIENPDPYDVENTLVKMATKRAYVDATLRATATSGLFTQDLEDGEAAHAPTPGPREPGSDDDVTDAEVVETSVGNVKPNAGQHAAAAGAEPNPDYDPEAPPGRNTRSEPAPRAVGKVACPHCGKPAGPSRYPKQGQTHYCYECKHAFAGGGQ